LLLYGPRVLRWAREYCGDARQLAALGSSDCPDYRAYARWYSPAARAVRTIPPRLYDRRVVASDLPATFAQLAAARTLATEVFVSYALAR